MARHKHADLIHAWAEGAEIQLKRGNGSWVTVEKPDWLASLEYRIKPRIVKREGWVNICQYNNRTNWVGATIFDSKVAAQANKPEQWVTTIKIEWGEEQ